MKASLGYLISNVKQRWHFSTHIKKLRGINMKVQEKDYKVLP